MLQVRPTCIDVPIDVPCASEHDDGPQQFKAVFTGTAGAVSYGPMSPSAVEVHSQSGKVLLGTAVSPNTHTHPGESLPPPL